MRRAQHSGMPSHGPEIFITSVPEADRSAYSVPTLDASSLVTLPSLNEVSKLFTERLRGIPGARDWQVLGEGSVKVHVADRFSEAGSLIRALEDEFAERFPGLFIDVWLSESNPGGETVTRMAPVAHSTC